MKAWWKKWKKGDVVIHIKTGSVYLIQKIQKPSKKKDPAIISTVPRAWDEQLFVVSSIFVHKESFRSEKAFLEVYHSKEETEVLEVMKS